MQEEDQDERRQVGEGGIGGRGRTSATCPPRKHLTIGTCVNGQSHWIIGTRSKVLFKDFSDHEGDLRWETKVVYGPDMCYHYFRVLV